MGASTPRVLRGALVLFLVAGVLAVTLRYRFPFVGPGARAPEISLPLFQTGELVTLSGLEGKVVLVNFWATDCPPCIQELPSLQRLYERFSDQGLVILAVNQDGSPFWSSTHRLAPIPGDEADIAAAAADPFDTPRRRVEWWIQSFRERYRFTFPVLMDWEGVAVKAYQATGLPETFVVGADGLIYEKVISRTEWDGPFQVELIERLLAAAANR